MLEKVVRQRVGNGTDLTPLTTLSLEDADLSDLCGLDLLCPNLISLDLKKNRITSLEGIPPSVTRLRVSYNPLCSLRHCPPNLHSLGCSFTWLRDFNGCATTLRQLVCSSASLTSMQGLPTTMDRVLLSYNSTLQDISAAPKCVGDVLDLSCNSITDDMLKAWFASPGHLEIGELNLMHNRLTQFIPPLPPDGTKGKIGILRLRQNQISSSRDIDVRAYSTDLIVVDHCCFRAVECKSVDDFFERHPTLREFIGDTVSRQRRKIAIK